MRITGRSIRSLDRRLPGVAAGQAVLPALVDLGRYSDLLVRAGLQWPIRDGDAVLPLAVGPRSRFNAEGGAHVHHDRPKEQVWRIVWARWLEWHGREEIEQRGARPRAYWQFPRTPVPPPGILLRVTQAPDGGPILVTEPVRYGVDEPDRLMHEINLLLELFGECELLTEDLGPLLGPPSRLLNWEILPPGQRPWDALRRELSELTESLPTEHAKVAEYRLRLMHSFGPDFQAYGRGGFRGYVVFGFEKSGLYVLESLYTGNATYVFGDDWERLSSLTKAQIIRGHLAAHRIVHRMGWEDQLRRVLR